MRPGMLRAGFAALSMMLVLTACGGSSGGGASPGDTPLERALAATPANSDSITWWGFTDVAAIHELGGFDKIATPYGQAAMFGYGSLAVYIQSMNDGFLPSESDPAATAVSYGMAPNAVIRLTGVADVDATYGELEGERSDLEGGTLLIRAEDHKIDPSDDTFGAPMIGTFNSIWYDDGTVVAAAAQALVKNAVNDSGDSLRDAEAYQGVADCLGDAVAAQLTSAKFAGTPGNVAIGVRDDDAQGTQVLCVRSDDPEAQAETIRTNLRSGADPTTAQPWSKALDGAEVDTIDGWVRVTQADGSSPAIFYQMLVKRGLPDLLD